MNQPPQRRLTPPGTKIQRLAHRLIGTPGNEQVDELSDLERWECRQLDMLAFACCGCDYWFAVTERVEMNDDLWYCTECARERGHGKA